MYPHASSAAASGTLLSKLGGGASKIIGRGGGALASALKAGGGGHGHAGAPSAGAPPPPIQVRVRDQEAPVQSHGSPFSN